MNNRIEEALKQAGISGLDEDAIETIHCIVKDFEEQGYETKKATALKSIEELYAEIDNGNLMTSTNLQRIFKAVKDFYTSKKRESLSSRSLDVISKAPKTKFYLPKMVEFQKATWGMQAGFYLISGDSQVGKTAFLINLAMNILNGNENSKVYFFSLDDRIIKFKERLVSCQSYFEGGSVYDAVDSDYAFYECTHEDYSGEPQINPVVANNRSRAIEKIREWNNKRLFLYDGKYDVPSFESEVEGIDRENGILIIDAVYRIKAGGKDKIDKEENLVCWVKDLANELMIPVVCVKDVRKSDKRGATTKDNKRIRSGYSSDDMRGTVLWDYEADVIMMLSEIEETEIPFTNLINMKLDKNKIRGIKVRKDMELNWKKSVYMEV